MTIKILQASLVFGLALAASVLAQPRFIDATASAGLNFTLSYGSFFDEISNFPDAGRRENVKVLWRNMGNGVAVGDYDKDGDLDIYLLAQLDESNKLFRNNVIGLGTKTFTDVTAAPLNDLGMSRIAHFADLDNDGWLDLLLLNDDQRVADATPDDTSDDTSDHPTSKIFRNNGDGTWTDVTAGSGFNPFGYIRGGAALADYNNDGLVDIYLPLWLAAGLTAPGDPGLFPGANQLFKNKGGFEFEEVTAATGLDGLELDSFTSIFTDFDGDFKPDLFVAVDHFEDAYYTNAGDNTFTDVDEAAIGLDHVGNDMGVAVADIDDDDDLDLYATNIRDPIGPFGNLPKANALHINQSDLGGGLSFVDEAVTRGMEGTDWGWGTAFVDVDNDGDLDLLAVNGFDVFAESFVSPNPCGVCDSPSFLFVNDGAGNFAHETGTGLDTTFNLGWDSRGLVAFDYDRDGDQDFIVTNVNESVELVENTTGEGAKSAANHYLTVQPEPYHLAVGARVYATMGAAEKRRDVIPARSYMSGFPTEVHFGLGATSQTDLRVVWADGCETSLFGVATNQVLQISYFSLDFQSAGNLTFEEDQPVLLTASATDCPGDRSADIEWAEGTPGNVVETGGVLNASGRAVGEHPFFVTLRDDNGASVSESFTLEILPAHPPLRSQAAPSGELPTESTMATLTLTTDEDATCRLATTPGTSYDAMPVTFDTTGGKAHSTLVTGLTAGTDYNYQVRCQDAFGHANGDDLSVQFSVAPEPMADLAISLTTSVDPVVVGANFEYIALVTNAGTEPASDLTVTITLPTNVGLTGVSGDGWLCTSNFPTVTCSRASLGVATAPPIRVAVTAPANAAMLTALASVAATTHDPQAGDNMATENTRVDNGSPVLDPLTTPTMATFDELLTFTATANDPNGDGLVFSLVGAPSGASIHPSTGVFTWTPTAEQGSQTYHFTVVVTDDDLTDPLSDNQAVQVVVTGPESQRIFASDFESGDTSTWSITN